MLHLDAGNHLRSPTSTFSISMKISECIRQGRATSLSRSGLTSLAVFPGLLLLAWSKIQEIHQKTRFCKRKNEDLKLKKVPSFFFLTHSLFMNQKNLLEASPVSLKSCFPRLLNLPNHRSLPVRTIFVGTRTHTLATGDVLVSYSPR